MTAASSSSSSSSSSSHSTHDVFLNFNGETRRNFVCHLFKEVVDKGVDCYMDTKGLPKGAEIEDLLVAIEDSRLAVVIFSENYASSTFCLRELVRIQELYRAKKLQVLVIFYEVKTSDIKKIEGSFKEAFKKHKSDPNIGRKERKRWKSALKEVAGIHGWESTKSPNDAVLVQEFAEEICTKLTRTLSSKCYGLSGMKNHIKKIKAQLGTSDDVGYHGIWGPVGIGKTTILKVVYDKISSEFEYHCFLEKVNEGLKSVEEDMKEKLLSNMFGKSYQKSNSNMFLRKLSTEKVLIILDDVESHFQIEAILGQRRSFGPGSRILIGTRNYQSLRGVNAEIYKVDPLKEKNARSLFMRYAFKTKQPPPEYVSCVTRAIEYAQGLPSALVHLGDHLLTKSVREWKEELDKLKEIPLGGIHDAFRKSFDELKPLQQKVFLYVACVLNGMNESYATEILNSCSVHLCSELSVLIDRALVTISPNNKLEMHSSYQKLGWEDVRRKSIRSGRLMLLTSEEVDAVQLTPNTATEEVEGIILELSNSSKGECINAEALAMMKYVMFLKIVDSCPSRDDCKQNVRGDLVFSEKLRCLIWVGYPFNSLPPNFEPKNLVYLDLSFSRIKRLTERIEVLDKLVYLSLKGCKEFQSLAASIYMKYLQTLDLSGCSNLLKFPDISGVMEALKAIHLDETAIKELPRSVENLLGLLLLSMKNCKSLVRLPDTIHKLPCFEEFILSGCSKLHQLPGNLGHSKSLLKLEIEESGIKELPSSVKENPSLKIFVLQFYQGNYTEVQNLSTTQPQAHCDSSKSHLSTGSKRKRKSGREDGEKMVRCLQQRVLQTAVLGSAHH